jgi:hypothetical protein
MSQETKPPRTDKRKRFEDGTQMLTSALHAVTQGEYHMFTVNAVFVSLAAYVGTMEEEEFMAAFEWSQETCEHETCGCKNIVEALWAVLRAMREDYQDTTGKRLPRCLKFANRKAVTVTRDVRAGELLNSADIACTAHGVEWIEVKAEDTGITFRICKQCGRELL